VKDDKQMESICTNRSKLSSEAFDRKTKEMRMKHIASSLHVALSVLLVVSATAATLTAQEPGKPAQGRPNIVVILVDDMGYSSLGSFGGEIETPNLDSLAASGMRFSQFYNCAKCTSSRISIMSGQYEGRAGGKAFKNSVTMGEALQPAGYRTIAVGKWHLDTNKNPVQYGFDRHFGNLGGFSSYFRGGEAYYKNGKPFKDFPKEFYTTDAFTDFSIESIQELIDEGSEQPFLLYLAFNAPHSPLQSKKEDYEKYLATYQAGWDEIRQARYKRQLEMGLIDKKWQLSPRPKFIPAWEDLSDEEKIIQTKKMAAYAGLVDNVDQNVGKLVEFLKKSDRWENTLFLFLSDNGASPFTNPKTKNKAAWDPENKLSVGVSWAHADNTPFRWFKQNQHEGGISTPAIVHYPKIMGREKGTIDHTPLHVMDVLPTFLDLVGVAYPDSYPEREIKQPSGRSFLSLLAGKKKTLHEELFFQYMDNRALRSGDWKLTSARQGKWELYNLKTDRTETQDLARQHPEKVEAMKARWYELAKTETKVKPDYMQPAKGDPRPWGLSGEGKTDRRQSVAGEIMKESGKKKKK